MITALQLRSRNLTPVRNYSSRGSSSPTTYLKIHPTSRFTSAFDLHEMFKKYITPKEVHQSYSALGVPEGFWWARYTSVDDAQKVKDAIEAERPLIGFRTVKANYATYFEWDKSHFIAGAYLPVLKSDWFRKLVFVRNLPKTFQKQDCQNIFISFRLEHSDIHYLFKRDSNQQMMQGCALIRFVSDEEAHRAILLHHRTYYRDQQLELQLIE
ncbi:hypothetical protein HMI54_012994 [Coelomomyces lativittatus]|nr:hypothetical protein HMI54_012994 [Coelomomyces lativittatus]